MEPCTTDPHARPLGQRDARRTAPALRPPAERLPIRTADDGSSALRELVAQGFTPTEAGNLAAYLLGLARTDDGWTIDEIERLLFASHLLSHRYIRS